MRHPEELYELRHFDTVLLTFAAEDHSADPKVSVTWWNKDQYSLLPLEIQYPAKKKKPSDSSVSRWLRHRAVPKNRAYVHSFLAKCGLNPNRPLDIIRVSKGLSVNDCYWVTEAGFDGSFADFNLYDNRFNNLLALIAFTGYGSSIRSAFTSSPEFTTNGMLPKCWRRMGGTITLFKGGTSGASNTGYEPYSEYYATQVADALGVKTVPYGLSRWKGELCSTCALFTDKQYSFVPVGRLVREGGMQAVEAFYQQLGKRFTDALADMFVFDALIFNTDRHYGNVGVLVDNRKNTIAAPAPLFDHGNALFNYAGRDELSSSALFDAYAKTLLPCVYDDFTETAVAHIQPRHRKALRAMTGFRFHKHPRYNLPSTRLQLIEEQIQKRARVLLG